MVIMLQTRSEDGLVTVARTAIYSTGVGYAGEAAAKLRFMQPYVTKPERWLSNRTCVTKPSLVTASTVRWPTRPALITMVE
jgi:hypothetical protein